LVSKTIISLDLQKIQYFSYIKVIYGKELEVKETIEIASSASFLDIYLTCDTYNHLFTKLYDKRDDFNVAIINFPHLHSITFMKHKTRDDSLENTLT
jgi:hypothetical protein